MLSASSGWYPPEWPLLAGHARWAYLQQNAFFCSDQPLAEFRKPASQSKLRAVEVLVLLREQWTPSGAVPSLQHQTLFSSDQPLSACSTATLQLNPRLQPRRKVLQQYSFFSRLHLSFQSEYWSMQSNVTAAFDDRRGLEGAEPPAASSSLAALFAVVCGEGPLPAWGTRCCQMQMVASAVRTPSPTASRAGRDESRHMERSSSTSNSPAPAPTNLYVDTWR
mmetsp:Transcript_32268/g.87449  ORF Transcript_32268/g.87449 Transcript_32268/m.87449 type:complete len:222 (+) Transcript_32268:498-1163(+)